MDNGIMFRAKMLDEAWEFWYNTLTQQVNHMDSRDGEVVGEVLNAVTVLEDPTKNIMKSDIRRLPMRYCIGELLWYLSGNNDLESIRMYTSAWDRMADDGKTVNSNYGHRIQHAKCEVDQNEFDQLSMCYELLKKDPNSRQAVITIKPPRNILAHPTKDLNCTVCLQFLLRDEKLYMTTYMRSNDLWMGFPNDIFQFTCMQIYLAMRLGVKLGTYTHVAGSLHLYKRDYLTAQNNVNRKAKDENQTDQI